MLKEMIKDKKAVTKTSFVILGVLALIFSIVMIVADVVPSVATISTDKADYAPEEIVKISGSGFEPNTDLFVVLTRPTDPLTTESCDSSSCNSRFLDGLLTSDEEGSFYDYKYDLDGVLGEYTIDIDDGEGNSATTTFTDGRTIDSVELNNNGDPWTPPSPSTNGDNVNVNPSESISVTVRVTTTGSGDYNDWESTRYRFDTGSWTCENTPDHTTAGAFTETFNIVAPLSVDIYDLEIQAYDGNSCSASYPSAGLTLTNAITVHNPQPFCGDGQKNQPSEECDDGNDDDDDGCDSSCEIEDGWSCTGQPSICTVDNPKLSSSCGIDIALIIDNSASISSDELTTMKNAFKAFVDAFLPNTPTQMAVVKFNTDGNLVLDYNNDKTTIKNSIDSVTTSYGYTNWQDGLKEAYDEFNNSPKPDLYVFASDGNPNRYGDPAQSAIESVAVAQAVLKANQIKLSGTRIITLGIGDDLDADNLKAISSDDAYYSSDFENLADDLADLADELCGGTITVKKLVDGTPASGWTFSTSVTGGSSNPESSTTGGDGFINPVFDIDISGTTANVDLKEILQEGYFITNAVCLKEDQTPVGIFNGVDTVEDIDLGKFDSVYCEFENVFDNLCPVVEVLIPPATPDITWYSGIINVEATVSDYQSGVKEARVIFHDNTPKTWQDGFFDMTYNSLEGRWEYNWDTLTAPIPGDCSIVSADVAGEDYAGNGVNNNCLDTNRFGVDNAPPVTTKTVGEPSVDEVTGDNYYVKTTTKFTLTATDCGSGVDYIHYEIWWDSNDDGTVDTIKVNTNIYDDEITFYFTEESIHEIRWYAVDKLGNTEDTHYQKHAVEDTEPKTTKTIIGPQQDGQSPVHKYLTSSSTITLDCQDADPHPVGGEILHWEMYWSWNNLESWTLMGSGSEISGHKEFTQLSDSYHKFVYWCEDALGNEEASVTEIDAVDNEAPTIKKTVKGPYYGNCPPKPILSETFCVTGGDECPPPQDECYLDTASSIEVESIDSDPHPVGLDECYWWYYLTEEGDTAPTRYPIEGSYDTFPIILPEESQHELHIVCEDLLGNSYEDIETFLVDKTPPITTKSYTGAQYPNPIIEGQTPYPHWITPETFVSLEVEDAGPHKSGIKETKYRVTQVANEYCWTPASGCSTAQGSGEFLNYIEPFTMEESCHLIEYYSVDNVDKTEDVKKQCVFVDNTAPETDKDLVGPKLLCEDDTDKCGPEGQWDPYYVTSSTDITLSCEDQIPHPVGGEKVCFKVSWHGTEYSPQEFSYITQSYGTPNDEGYVCVDVDENKEYTFNFLEDSLHNIEWYCEDALGNKGEEQIEYDNVDNKGPYISIVKPEEKANVERCSQKILIQVIDEKSGVNESSIHAVLVDNGGEGEIVKDIPLDKITYGDDGEITVTYEEIMEKDLPSGWYELIIYASDNLGNQGEESLMEYLDETVKVQYIDPLDCEITPGEDGECNFTFNICIRSGNSIKFWMDELGDLVTPGRMNAFISKGDYTADVGLKEVKDWGYEKCQEEIDKGFAYVWDDDEEICWFKTVAGTLPLSCEEINGGTDFDLSFNLTGDITSQLGGINKINYFIESFTDTDSPLCPEPPVYS